VGRLDGTVATSGLTRRQGRTRRHLRLHARDYWFAAAAVTTVVVLMMVAGGVIPVHDDLRPTAGDTDRQTAAGAGPPAREVPLPAGQGVLTSGLVLADPAPLLTSLQRNGKTGVWRSRVRTEAASAGGSGGSGAVALRGNWSVVDGRPGSTAVRFARQSIGVGPVGGGFDPRRHAFAVGVVFRFPMGAAALRGTDSPNIVQKGLYDAPGQWKLEVVNTSGGEVACRVKGDRGSTALVSPVKGVARDRKWHTAVCARSGDRVELMVDGIRTGGVSPLGVVNNRAHLTIGNKYRRAWSDQFRGTVDEIVFARGRGAGAAVRLALRNR
jgi:hypothetical protein